MPQVIIFADENNSVSVCYPTGELPIDVVKAKDTPEGSIIIDSEELPNADNDFFYAWKLVNGSVVVDLLTAKNLTKTRLRQEREPLLTALDIAYQRADEAGDVQKKAEIVLEKQRLRDLPTLTDTCTTLDELRALKP